RPDTPLSWRCSSVPSPGAQGRRWPLPRGSGKKNSNGSIPVPRLRMSLVLTISVVVIETTAGMTRDATSANDGMVTDVAGSTADVVWIGATVCAIVFGMRPRSALIRTPKVTDAITIAMVDNMRFIFIDWFIGFVVPLRYL